MMCLLIRFGADKDKHDFDPHFGSSIWKHLAV